MKIRNWYNRKHIKLPMPPGPWDDEPDKRQWGDPYTGLPCLLVRNHMGALCGYVGITREHPFYGLHYDDGGPQDLSVHGGLTFSAKGSFDEVHPGPTICHMPDPGEEIDLWWFGFDCAHSGDMMPVMQTDESPYAVGHGVYRNLDYVTAECSSLAEQLMEAADVDD